MNHITPQSGIPTNLKRLPWMMALAPLPRPNLGANIAPLAWGAIAQLGERLNGIQEVRGSIPLGSTSPPPPQSGNQTPRHPLR